MSEPTPGERQIAARLSVEAGQIAAARDALNIIATLPWPGTERISLVTRLARTAHADVGKVFAKLALDAAPVGTFDALLPIKGLGYKRLAGLVRALAGVDRDSLAKPDQDLRKAQAEIAAARSENAALRTENAALRTENATLRNELDRMRVQTDDQSGGPSMTSTMRIDEVARSLGSQVALVDQMLRSQSSGIRLSGVDIRLQGAGAGIDGDVALDLARPDSGSAVSISFVPSTTSVPAVSDATSVVPDVCGYTTAMARRKLAALGFKASIAVVAGASNVVSAQSPAANSTVRLGSVVRLIIQ